MQEDNVLGAPTEGLGQTPTFVPNVGNQDVITGGGDPGRSRMGILGGFGPAVKPGQFMAEDTTNHTARFLAKTLGRTMEAVGKEQETQQFLVGMQRAMAGEAVEDIAAEQPWYSKIFGDSDVVAGARAYGQEARVQRAMSDMETRMPALRQLSEADASAMYADTVKKSMTGHTATDAAIMASFQRSMPGFMKQRAKEHYAYMQEQAATEQSGALLAAADRIQSAHGKLLEQLISPEDFATRKAEVGGLATPALGQDLKSWQLARMSDISVMLERGQFHAVNALEEVGIVEHLTPTQQAQYQRLREANEGQFRAKAGQEFIDMLTTFKDRAERGGEGWTMEATLNFGRGFNTLWKSRTGSRSDFISPETLAAYGEKTGQAIQARIDADERARVAMSNARLKGADAAQAELFAQQEVLKHFNSGHYKAASYLDKVPDEKIDQWVAAAVMPAVNDPYNKDSSQAFYNLGIGAIGGKVNPLVKMALRSEVASAVSEGQPTPSFSRAYEQWRQMWLTAGPEATVHYYGDETNTRFEKFRLMHPEALANVPAPNSPAMAAFQSSFGINSIPRMKKFTEKETKAWLDSAMSKLGGWFDGEIDVKSAQRNAVETMLTQYAQVHGEAMSPEAAGKLAVASARRDGGQFYGGYFWQDRKVGNLRDHIQALLDPRKPNGVALPEGDEFSDYVGESIDSMLEKSGAKGKVAARVYATADGIHAVGYDRDMKPVNAAIKFTDIANEMRDKTLAKRKAAKLDAPILPQSNQFAPKAELPRIPK